METTLEENTQQGVRVAARAVDAVKVYGSGDAAVRARRGCRADVAFDFC